MPVDEAVERTIDADECRAIDTNAGADTDGSTADESMAEYRCSRIEQLVIKYIINVMVLFVEIRYDVTSENLNAHVGQTTYRRARLS